MPHCWSVMNPCGCRRMIRSWQETSFHRPAELFLWEIGNDVEHIMFLARMPTIWLSLLMPPSGARWATEMSAGWARIGEIAGPPYLLASSQWFCWPSIPTFWRTCGFVTTDLGLGSQGNVGCLHAVAILSVALH